MDGPQLDRLGINTLRTLSMDAVEKAKSGHPGAPMGAALMAYVLWTRFLKHNPANPAWPDRDRFVLSAGHACALLYSLLHLTGYDLSLDEIKNFRQWGSRTPGHTEHGLTPGVEATTGPLGQGFANGVGMAIAERVLAEHFNRPGLDIVNHYVYALVSDGDLMEGISSEAASLAGHLRLGKLIYLYDDNHITIEGSTDLAFTEDVAARFQAYRWHVQRVDGHDIEAVAAAIAAAQAEEDRPSLILARTHIAFGSPHKQDTAEAHGAPLGEEEVKLTKQNLGWPVEPPFYVPPEALAHFRQALKRGRAWEAQWQAKMREYAAKYPQEATLWHQRQKGELPPGWDADIPTFKPEEGPMATRVASGRVLHALAKRVPALIGGSADLGPSVNTYLKGYGDFAFGQYGARNLHFGVREHAMGGIANGLALHGGLIPFVGTFLIFSDYMRPSLRLAALTKLRVTFVFSHDSIALGEDGPTHQPVEHLASLRAIPGLTVLRPADATETAEAWRVALQNREGPTALILTRQNVPVLERSNLAPASAVAQGGYILTEASQSPPDLLLIASGSEVHLALQAQKRLAEKGISARVVSLPSWEIFEAQPEAYRHQVLPPAVKARLAIEAGSPLGWERYVGESGIILGLDRFGASAPGPIAYAKLGFTVENVVSLALKVLGR